MKEGDRSYAVIVNSDAKDHDMEDGACKWCGIREGWAGATAVCRSIFIKTDLEKKAKARAATAERRRLRLKPSV